MFNGQYVFPPRTKTAIPFYHNGQISEVLNYWMSQTRVWAQYKLNGTRNLIYVSPSGEIRFWNRHKELQKYDIPQAMEQLITDKSPKGKWTVWDSELLHYKTVQIKNLVYLYDVLVFNGVQLLDVTYENRYKIITDQFGPRYLPLIGPLNDYIYVAQNFLPNDWKHCWEAIKKIDWIEGLVLKRYDYSSRLQPGFREVNNESFMCRVRKPHKNYLF